MIVALLILAVAAIAVALILEVILNRITSKHNGNSNTLTGA